MTEPAFTLEDQLLEMRQMIEVMKEGLVVCINGGEISDRAKIPFKVVSMQATLLYRAVELSEVATDLYEKSLLVSAFTISRAMMETTAVLFMLHKRAKQTVETGTIGDFDDFIMKALHGSRDPSLKSRYPDEFIDAVNIMTLIDHVNKKYEHFREMYEELCEYAHPNWHGVQGTYCRIDTRTGSIYLGPCAGGAPLLNGLLHLISAASIFRWSYNDLTDILPKFTAICEADLKKMEN